MNEIEYFDFDDDYYAEKYEYNWTYDCLLPTLSDAFTNFYLPILVANVFARLLSVLIDILLTSKLHYNPPPNTPLSLKFNLLGALSYIHHVIFIISGSWLLHEHLRNDSFQVKLFLWIVLFFAAFTNALFTFLQNILYSRIFLIFCLKSIFFFLQFFYIALNEYQIHVAGYSENLKLRPLLMLIVMKSVAFFKDQEYSFKKPSEKVNSFNPFPLLLNSFAYILHPSAVVLGVWHYPKSRPQIVGSFKELFQRTKFSFLRFIKSFLITFVSLSFSSCFVDYFEKNILTSNFVEEFKNILKPILPESIQNSFDILLTAYLIALKFHCSHFFICFAAESMFSLWEIDLKVTKPFHILYPYSMVQLVISWNIPMHLWLKRYVFKPLHKYLPTFVTILFTYLISSYLHGLNCQIWAVLLTLGICTQVEYKFRSKISRTLSACIDSKSCKNNCEKEHHRNNEYSFTKIANLILSLIVIANLSFLGSTFDGNPESGSCYNVHFIWSHLYYFPYLISLCEYLIAIII